MTEHVTTAAASELAVQSILLQLIVVIAAARLIAVIGKRFGQAVVVGEMLAGIMLGPSLFGYLAPDAFSYVFSAGTGPVFSGLAQVGLVLLMFQIGLEFELGAAVAARRTVLGVSLLGIVIPFVLGGVASVYFYEQLAEPRPEEMGFTLIFAVSMSITALPVLGRISAETGLDRTRAGAIAISAAAIDDVVGWSLLGAIILLISGHFSLDWVALRVVGLCAVGAIAVYVLRPRLHRYFDRHLAAHGRLEYAGISLVLVLLFACSLVTSVLGLHALIGGFVLGVALHQHEGFVAEWRSRIGPLVITLFLPIFFTQTGLRTDVGSLGGGAELVQCALICGLAFVCKFGGGYVGARLAGESPRTASVLGICMNTRGLMELVVLNVGYELGVLPKSLFTQLVYMAVLTTVIATPLIRRYMRTEPAGAAAAA
ncbi:MAG TPA: cation:proton antiporter [Kofleriaceae bacterium]|nr:cation:proton antiporter [Kofleriaceae bacterium]